MRFAWKNNNQYMLVNNYIKLLVTSKGYGREDGTVN